jgi:hypothetical protein
VYVGVTLYDSDPSQVIVTDSRRDSSLGDADSFQMIFDTYHDRQNGFLFGTNAAGVQYDAQVRDEGQGGGGGGGGGAAFGGGGRAQTGSGGGSNVNWDASWDVKAQITDIGWTAEFQIPLRSLRYGPPPQAWGLNFSRNIRRKREQTYWASVPRQYTLNRLSLAGELRGLDLAAPRNFTITPYITGSANRDFGSRPKTTNDGNIGFDTKFGVTPSMNLDVTYRTDFAQVEVDEQQINLTRFNIVFPEKRPFFLENAGLFSVGRQGDVDLFFSRRIGITDDGALVPILAGARLSGKASGVNVGLLNIQTEEVGLTPANNYTAARVNRELPNRSSVGGIFVGQTATGDLAGTNNWNRTWGVDGKLGVGETLTFSGFGAKTETPGLSGRQYAFNGGVAFQTRAHRANLEYGEVGEDFNPAVGFLRRTDGSRRLSYGWFTTLRSPKINEMGFRELAPHFSYQRFSNLQGELETATLHMDNHLDWENGNYIAPGLNIQWEGLSRPFEIYKGIVVPAGNYRSPHLAWRTNTDRRKAVFFNFDWDYGEFLSGRQNNISPAVSWRKGGSLNVVGRWTRNNIDLPQGAFKTNLGSLRATYNFSTTLFAQTLIQYNDLTDRWSTNLRLTWLRTANTGIFVVYNDTESLNGLGPINRAFIIKYSHQLDVFR